MLTDQFQFVKSIGQGQLLQPYAVDCSHLTHHIVTADNGHQLHLFSSDRSTLIRSFCSSGSNIDQTNIVYGMCFDDERKRILVCDNGNKRLSIWSNDGSTFINTIKMPNNRIPISICVDYHQGSHRIIVGTYQSEIIIFDSSNNEVIQTLGTEIHQSDQGISNYIAGVYVASDGVLLATDSDNDRVQMF